VITDLTEIRRLAAEKEPENLEFRRHLKAHHVPEGPFHVLAREAEQRMDCRQCANCCRETTVDVSEAEVAAIASLLGCTIEQAMRQYTGLDPNDHHRVLLREQGACVFLDHNECTIYDARPRPCRDYPHLSREVTSLGGRMESACRNAAICPIVYDALEAYKKLVGFHPHHHGPHTA
jgi:uncharacterized protein